LSVAMAGKVETKRERVLDAARKLFLRNGLRGTTMEAIAREARIAKPTLYAHFADKDAVFLAILEQLLADKAAAFEAGLAGIGPVEARIGTALAAEFAVIATALAGSPHADELFAAHRQAAELFRRSDEWVVNRLQAELDAAGVAEAARLARLVLDASFGLAQKAIGRSDMGADIALLATRLIGPALPPR
jgi:AcrR family transcriptional regulator